MPRLDGLEATRRIRSATGQTERPWIVAITAFTSTEERAAALESGMNEVLANPLKPEALMASSSAPMPAATPVPARDGTLAVELELRVAVGLHRLQQPSAIPWSAPMASPIHV